MILKEGDVTRWHSGSPCHRVKGGWRREWGKRSCYQESDQKYDLIEPLEIFTTIPRVIVSKTKLEGFSSYTVVLKHFRGIHYDYTSVSFLGDKIFSQRWTYFGWSVWGYFNVVSPRSLWSNCNICLFNLRTNRKLTKRSPQNPYPWTISLFLCGRKKSQKNFLSTHVQQLKRLTRRS